MLNLFRTSNKRESKRLFVRGMSNICDIIWYSLHEDQINKIVFNIKMLFYKKDILP